MRSRTRVEPGHGRGPAYPGHRRGPTPAGGHPPVMWIHFQNESDPCAEPSKNKDYFTLKVIFGGASGTLENHFESDWIHFSE